MKTIKLISFMCVMIVLILGCSFLTPPKEKPVIQGYVGTQMIGEKTTHVFSMTPERRTVIVIPRKQKNKDTEQIENTVMFCAEPPPDVAESLADTLRFLAEAQLEKSDINVGTEFYRSFTSSAMSLFHRSQGIQLFRDGMYNLCQARLNGMINDTEYSTKYDDLLKNANTLIGDEIKIMGKIETVEQAQQAIRAMNEAIRVKTEVEIIKQKMDTDMKKVEKYKNSIENIEKDIIEEVEDLRKEVKRLKR